MVDTSGVRRAALVGVPELLKREPGATIVRLLALIALHALLWPAFYHWPLLDAASYRQPVLLAEALAQPRLLVLCAVTVGPLLAFRRRIAWPEIDATGRSRILVTAIGLLLPWAIAAAPYNLYFDQWHAVDRIVLLVAAILVWWHPLFMPLALLSLALLMGVLTQPLVASHVHWPDKRLPFDMMVLCTSFFMLRCVSRCHVRVLAMGALCLLAATYSDAGFSKLRLGPDLWTWPIENRVSNMLVSAHVHAGWLANLHSAQVVGLARAFADWDVVIQSFTLVAECGTVFVLLTRRVTQALLTLVVLMHVGILSMTGILFWKWIIVDLALLWYVSGSWPRKEKPEAPFLREMYRPSLLLVSLLIIASTKLWVRNADFAWYDSKYINYYVFEGVSERGDVRRIDPRFFAPYDILFEQSRFYYLSPRKVLAGTYGVSRNIDAVRALESAGRDEVGAIRAEFGEVFYRQPYIPPFARFVAAYVKRAPERRAQAQAFRWVGPPWHFQTMSSGGTYTGEQPLVRLDVFFEERFFDGKQIHPIARHREMTIDLVSGYVELARGEAAQQVDSTEAP